MLVEEALRKQEPLMKVLQGKWLVEKALQRQEPLRKRLQRVGKGLLKKALRKWRVERA